MRACHILCQRLSKFAGATVNGKFCFQTRIWRSKAFHRRYDDRMVAFTNALRQENGATALFFRLAPLVLKPGCVAQGSKKILLVEDNNEVRELLALFMTRLGYKVFEAATGLKAIDLASTVQPNLIIMDLRLPEMNGTETTARLKANPSTRDIPLLVITGYAAGIDTRRALDAGAAEILHKPIDVTRLSNVLRRYLSTRTAKRRASKKSAFNK